MCVALVWCLCVWHQCDTVCVGDHWHWCLCGCVCSFGLMFVSVCGTSVIRCVSVITVTDVCVAVCVALVWCLWHQCGTMCITVITITDVCVDVCVALVWCLWHQYGTMCITLWSLSLIFAWLCVWLWFDVCDTSMVQCVSHCDHYHWCLCGCVCGFGLMFVTPVWYNVYHTDHSLMFVWLCVWL